MNIEINKATQTDIDNVEQLYNDICDFLEKDINYPGWKKGVYPTRIDAENSFAEDALFVAKIDGIVVGSFILCHSSEAVYSNEKWHNKLSNSDVFVVFTFTVSPFYLKHGIGEKMLNFIDIYAKQNRVKAIRLDVYEKNSPAILLYKKCGYVHSHTASLGLEDIGLNHFYFFEKPL